MSFNKIIIVGNLGRDPELRYTPQGSAVCNFSMASTERRRDKSGEFQDVTTWFRVTIWEKRAETAAKWLKKGSQVYIEGRLKVDEWEDRDGKARYTLDVTATDMQFIGRASGEENSYSDGGGDEPEFAGPVSSGSSSAASASSSSSDSDDDIPF